MQLSLIRLHLLHYLLSYFIPSPYYIDLGPEWGKYTTFYAKRLSLRK